jgi:hypothetical protein
MYNIKFPLSTLKHQDYRHVTFDKPKRWIEIDTIILPKNLVEFYDLMGAVVVGTDVNSRYSCIFINPEATTHKSRGDVFTNFEGIVNQFKESSTTPEKDDKGKYPEYVTADNEFNVKKIKDFCNEHNIKLILTAPGVINATPIVDNAIKKLKKLLFKYIIKYNDEIIERAKKINNKYRNTIKIFNVLIYMYNRKFNTAVKGYPIEIFTGLDIAKLPISNDVEYPEYPVGQKVILRPRARLKGEIAAVLPKELRPGIPGEIVEKYSRNTYKIKTTLGGKQEFVYAKWYEFIPITDETFEKLRGIKLFQDIPK